MNREEIRGLINEKFGNIEFVDKTHQYFVNGDEYTPVSYVIKEYEPYVDWDLKAKEYASKRRLNADDVRRDWKLNNLKSTISGTRTHEFGESMTNLVAGHPELICESNRNQYVEEYNTLLPTYPKEEAISRFYEDLDNSMTSLVPIGAEFKLSTEYMTNTRKICGTCDILFYRDDIFLPDNSGIVIGDWKTNKSLYNEYNRSHNNRLLPPFDNMIDEALSHYTIQFNLYQKMLESIGIKIVDRILIWLKADGTYESINIPEIDEDRMKLVLGK